VSGAAKRIERMGRKRLARVLRHVLPAPDDSVPEEPGSILVVRPDSRLGNLVLMEPLVRSLKTRFPTSRIAVLTSDRFSELLSSQGYETIAVPKALFAGRPWLFPSFASRLRRMGFEVAIDASHPRSFSLSGAVAAAICGAPARIGFAAGDYRGWFSRAVAPCRADCHESMALHSLGSVWPGWPEWTRPRLEAAGAVARGTVGLHVGASRNKGYPTDRLRAVVGALAGKVRLEVYWGTARERELAAGLEGRGVKLMPSMGIVEMLESMAGLRAFVSADNGPMHAASALGVPVAALFMMDDAARFGPLSPGSRVLYAPGGADPEDVVGTVLEIAGS